MSKKTFVCDPETGLCHPIDIEGPTSHKVEKEDGKEIIYVGDPMCSWCWGISNHLIQLKDHYSKFQFSIVVGGLRPGGGDPWNKKMKDFLKHHWDEVNKRSGQPFGDQLFQLEHFNYDTEPSCRAVVASRKWMGDYELDFFEAVSRKFYVENEDPNEMNFYQSICEEFAIPFDDFSTVFNSEEAKRKTLEDFQLNRSWGVRGYPTVLFRIDKQLYQVSGGYADFERMKLIIEEVLENQKDQSKNG